MQRPSVRCPLMAIGMRSKQLPVPLGDNFDGAIGHFYGGLIVNRVRRHWYRGGHFFQVGRGILWESRVIQMPKQCGVVSVCTQPNLSPSFLFPV